MSLPFLVPLCLVLLSVISGVRLEFLGEWKGKAIYTTDLWHINNSNNNSDNKHSVLHVRFWVYTL